jgi:XRE family aerobic/anaerobic benzoate catabolism transcriptional regulator
MHPASQRGADASNPALFRIRSGKLTSESLDDGDFLQRIGARVRKARAERGMTRKLLARHSGVSERHLAELEAGRGNVSILLLRQVAEALNVHLAALVSAGPEPDATLQLTEAFLRRLRPEQIAEARELLLHHFGTPGEAEREGRIALIGLRGAGKSTLGALLAERRGVPFIELDRRIEALSGLSLEAIFELYGQAGFRRLERQALEAAFETEPTFVLATSGSIVSDAETFGRLLAMCRTVWLRAAPREHMERVIAQGDMRPMADNREAMADLEQILAHREAMYARAEAILDTSGHDVESALADLERIFARPVKA